MGIHRPMLAIPSVFSAPSLKEIQLVFRPVARGGGGRTTPPPQLPIPKILFHPLAILFHPLAILFHLSAILFHPLAILFHLSAILFHPLAILFHVPLEYVDDVTRAMSKGGGACECPRVGAFFKLMTSRGQCPRGGCAWCSTHPSSDPPTPTWLAGYGPGVVRVTAPSLFTSKMAARPPF